MFMSMFTFMFAFMAKFMFMAMCPHRHWLRWIAKGGDGWFGLLGWLRDETRRVVWFGLVWSVGCETRLNVG